MDDNSVLLIIIAGFVVTGGLIASVGIFLGRFLSNGLSNRGVLAHGVPAPATILKAWQTGLVVNDTNPQIGLLLQVQPADRPAFQAETKMIVQMIEIPQFQPGVTVQVKYDPKDLRKVAVESVGGPAPTAQTTTTADTARVQAVQAMLEQLRDTESELQTRGISAQAQILTAANMGVNVNGDNPLMTFQLQVQATDRAPFSAMAQAAVDSSAIGRYQPGTTIWVKYDPTNTSRVIIDHS